MKHSFLALAFLQAVSLSAFGQTDSDVSLSYSCDGISLAYHPMKPARKITSSSIPTFEGAWTEEMKGAFEHACKLMEEIVPSTYSHPGESCA